MKQRLIFIWILFLPVASLAISQEAARPDKSAAKTAQVVSPESVPQTESTSTKGYSGQGGATPPPRDPKIYRIGNGVTPPRVISSEPSTDSHLLSNSQPESGSHKAKKSGVVMVGFVVDEDGVPINVHVLRSLNPEMDQKALEAIRSTRFKPATKKGIPVKVELMTEMQFALF